MVGGMMGVNVINYFYHLVMGRALDVDHYGTLGSVFSLLYIAGIVPLSSSFAIVKFISTFKNKKERDNFYASIKKIYFKTAVAILVLMVLLSPFISRFLNINDLKIVLFVGPIVFFTIITVVNMATMQGILKFHAVVIPNAISSVGKFLFGLLLVYLGYSVGGAILGIVIAAAVAYFYTAWDIKKHVNLNAKMKNYDLKPFFKYAMPVLVQSLAFTSFYSVDLLIVKHFLPPFEAGLYAALATLGKIIYFATQPVTAALFPIVSSKRSRGENYRSSFFMSFLLVFLLCMGVVIFYKFFAEFTINALYGEKYLGASNELFLMGLFMAIYSLSYMLINFLLSIHRVKVVIIPVILAILQIFVLWKNHATLAIVLKNNIWLSLIMLAGISIYLVYNEYKRRHVLQAKNAS